MRCGTWSGLASRSFLLSFLLLGLVCPHEARSDPGDPGDAQALISASIRLTSSLNRHSSRLSPEQMQQIGQFLFQAQSIINSTRSPGLSSPGAPSGAPYAPPIGAQPIIPGANSGGLGRNCLADSNPQVIQQTYDAVRSFVWGNLFSGSDEADRYTQGLLTKYSCTVASRYLQDLTSLFQFGTEVMSSSQEASVYAQRYIDRRCRPGLTTIDYKSMFDRFYATGSTIYSDSLSTRNYAIQRVTENLLGGPGTCRL